MIELAIPAALGVRLAGLARAHKTTLFRVLMSGFGLLLQRLTHQIRLTLQITFLLGLLLVELLLQILQVFLHQ